MLAIVAVEVPTGNMILDMVLSHLLEQADIT